MTNLSILEQLKEKALKLNAGEGVPFMEGREKGEELPKNSTVTLDAYGFIDGEDGEYVVLALKEFPQYFFFGGSVVTEKFLDLDGQLSEAEREFIKESGIPLIFKTLKSKKAKRKYTTCEFFPSDEV